MKIHNAKVVGDAVDGAVYRASDKPRGHKEFVMTRSDLCLFAENPRRWLDGYEPESSGSTDWGSMVDCKVLTPELFDKQYAVTPETYDDGKGNQKPWNWNASVCKAWQDERDGMECIKPEVADRVERAVRALKADGKAWQLISGSRRQVMVVGEYHTAAGVPVPLKALIDLVPEGDGDGFGLALADFKTARTGRADGWNRVVYAHGYHIQAAMYLDLWNAATGEKRNQWLHVVQENVPPYAVGRRFLSDEWMTIGRAFAESALELYGDCLALLAAGEWPGYDDGTRGIDGWTIVDPDPWMIERSPTVRRLNDSDDYPDGLSLREP